MVCLLLALVAGAVAPSARATAPALTPLERLPLCFEANHGQALPEAQFLARSRSGTFLLSPAKATVILTASEAPAPAARASAAGRVRNRRVQRHTVSLEFLGANGRAGMSGLDALSGKANYFLGSDPACWRANLPLFEKVRVAEVYPGIDVVYYGSQQKLEYDLVVAPGADAGAVRLRITGADRLELDAQGDLVLSIGDARLRQHKPVLHQLINGVVAPVAGGYRLLDPQTVGFQVGSYDSRAPLTIDPILTYASYFGGAGTDQAFGVAVDAAGNVYVAGETLSAGLSTTNAFQPNYNGGYPGGIGDAFVAKFSSTGSSLVYLTYLGGTGDDAALALAVDAAGAAYITGATDSPNFPIASAVQSAIAGSPSPIFGLHPFDAFVTKLSPSGSALVYSTYLGGDNQEEGLAIAVGADTSAFVTGFTQSPNFPTNRPYQAGLAGVANAFVTKFSPAGSNLIYSTYLGGTNLDQGAGIAVDAAGRAFVTGMTSSTNFPTLLAGQPRLGGGEDAFVTVVAADGQSLVRSTYLGGAANDAAYKIALDAAGGAYVVGTELSSWNADASWPITPGNLNPGGVFVSSDAGASWSAANVGLYHTQVPSLALDPTSSGRVYAGTGHGIARSLNGGANWNAAIAALPTDALLAPQIAVGNIYTVAVNPLTPSTLYAGTSGGVYRSLDAGLTWTLSNSGFTDSFPTTTVLSLAVDPVTPTTLYAAADGEGIFERTSDAASWVWIGSGLGTWNVFTLAIDPQTPARLYAGTDLGIYRRDTQGGLWAPFSNGLTNTYVLTVAVDPQIPAIVYAGTVGGLFRSVDRGTNWTALPLGVGFTNSMQVQALAIDPVTPATVYAGTTNGIFKSTDRGATWRIITNGLSVSGVRSLAVDPLNPAKLYAGTTQLHSFGGGGAFLTKLTNIAGAIQFSTVLSGGGINQGWAVAVDSLGNSYVVGNTTATNFPTAGAVGALSATNHGGNDVFVTAINADASAFLYSVYLGGSSDDIGYGVALDPTGSAWVVGQTSSSDFPTINAFQPALGGGMDGFVARVSPTPVLIAKRVGLTLQLSWLEPGSLFTLHRAASLPVPANGWTAVAQTPVVSNGWHTVTVPADGAAGFFRLHGP
jgi:hypothetical protein